jgi:hypothetical protein
VYGARCERSERRNYTYTSEALIEPKHELFGFCRVFARSRMKKPPEIGAAALGRGFDDHPAVECTNAEQPE